MPHYFFETAEGDRIHRDQESLELPDNQAAQKLALGCLSDLIHDNIDVVGCELSIRVRDADGRPFFEAKVSTAVL